MSPDASEQSAAVVKHHLEAFSAKDADAIASDYADDALLIGPGEVVKGRQAIRDWFNGFLAGLPEELFTNFEMGRHVTEGEVVYFHWRSRPVVEFATDTFIIRDGKIQVQTFAPMTDW